jgi:hypothetical protein
MTSGLCIIPEPIIEKSSENVVVGCGWVARHESLLKLLARVLEAYM